MHFSATNNRDPEANTIVGFDQSGRFGKSRYRAQVTLVPEARCGRSGRSLLAMPIRLYFMWVGSALLMALYCADKWLPDPSTHAHSSIPPGERVNLRIRSDHRWPERVVFDTAHPQMPLSSTFRSISEVIPGQDPAWTEQRGARDAFASSQMEW